MVIASRGAEKMGICNSETTEEIIKAVKLYGLCDLCPYSAMDIYGISLSDKKRSGEYMTLVLPKRTGECILKKIHINEIGAFFDSAISE